MISQEEVVTKTDSSNFAPHPAPPRAQQPFTPEEVSRIQTQLDAPIDNEYIQFRPSAQGSVGYVEGWKALSLMNEVFGFNGWSSEILHLGTDFTDIHDDRISLGMFCMVRIHLRDGTFHDVPPLLPADGVDKGNARTLDTDRRRISGARRRPLKRPARRPSPMR